MTTTAFPATHVVSAKAAPRQLSRKWLIAPAACALALGLFCASAIGVQARANQTIAAVSQPGCAGLAAMATQPFGTSASFAVQARADMLAEHCGPVIAP